MDYSVSDDEPGYDNFMKNYGAELDMPESLGFLYDFTSTETDGEPQQLSGEQDDMPEQLGDAGGYNFTSTEKEGDAPQQLGEGSYGTGYNSGGNTKTGSTLGTTIKDGIKSVSGYLNDNPNLAKVLMTGLAGSLLNKGGASAEQIAYARERQEALNKSITPYGKTYRKG